jgi:hypothetical protein
VGLGGLELPTKRLLSRDGEARRTANFNRSAHKKTLVARSVGETVGQLSWESAKYWSEWQDLNLRPPRPDRVVLSSAERRHIGPREKF